MSILRISRRGFVCGLAGAIAGAALSAPPLPAQELTRGYERTAPSTASGEELNRQRNIWVMEIDFKSMRMIFVDSADPQTGEKKTDRILYLVYRAINRPIDGSEDAEESRAVNAVEPPPGPEKFIPAFTLVAYDNPQNELPVETYPDAILPEAVRRINRIERRGSSEPMFLDSVSIVQDLPQPVDAAAEQQPYIYGVATWKNVDPDADYFKVIMEGFSNGYRVDNGPDGRPITSRKVVVQRIIRRGDRYDPNQMEFLFDGNPTWEYQPAKVSPQLPAGIEAPAAEPPPAVQDAPEPPAA